MRAAVVVLAAGAGTRVGAQVNKVLLPLAGVPVVARSVRTARSVPGVHRVVLVVRDGEQEAVRAAVEPWLDAQGPEVAMVTGGPTRHASEWQALSLLADDIESGEIEVVAMHDAARPLSRPDLYERVLHEAAAPAARSRWPRSTTWWTSTAQHCPTAWSASRRRRRSARPTCSPRTGAARAEGFEATDTAGCLAAFGSVAVVAVESGAGNLKLTVADDFLVAARHLALSAT